MTPMQAILTEAICKLLRLQGAERTPVEAFEIICLAHDTAERVAATMGDRPTPIEVSMVAGVACAVEACLACDADPEGEPSA